jgi:DNA-binding MarR family transcriptional regulator
MHDESDPKTWLHPGEAAIPSVSDLESHLGYWLRFVSNHVSQSFQRKVEAEGVTVSEWVVLRELYRLGPTSPGEIGRAIGMTKGAISKLVTRLESKGLLTRKVLDKDRRNHVLEPTPAGRALVPILAQLADRNDEEFFGHMPRQARDDLMDAMKEVVRLRRLKTVPLD